MADITFEQTDDPDKQVEQLTQALVFLLLTGTEHPYPIPIHEVRKMAEVGYKLGLTQGEPRDKDVEIHLPGYLIEGAREAAEEAPVMPDLTDPQETPLVGEAPSPPKKIAKRLLGVTVTE